MYYSVVILYTTTQIPILNSATWFIHKNYFNHIWFEYAKDNFFITKGKNGISVICIFKA